MIRWIAPALFLLVTTTACERPAKKNEVLSLNGDAAQGETLYEMPLLGETPAPGCRNCHAIEKDVVLVGPSLKNMSSYSAEYLLEAIVEPNQAIADGFQPDNMYSGYGDELSAQQIADLIAYIQSLE